MRARTMGLTVLLVAGGCSPPSPQPMPNEMEHVVNATRVDPGIVDDNEVANYSEGNVTPAEREPMHEVEQVLARKAVARLANFIVERRFDEAYGMWDPNAVDFTVDQFEQAFQPFDTIRAAIGNGSSGSSQVQLTLSGTTKSGKPYAITGPVTLAQSEGSDDWKVVKMVLTADPRAAEALVE